MRLLGRQAKTPRGRSFLAGAALLSAGALTVQILDGPAVPAATTINPGAPAAPVSVSAVPYAGGRALVSWLPGSGAESDSYQIETYLSTPAGLQDKGGTTAFGTDTVIGGLQLGGSYLFSVKAVNVSGAGPAANSNGMLAAGWLAPSAPTGVSLSSDGADNQLTLSWTQTASPVAAEVYKIGVYEGTGPTLKQVGAANCDAPCNSLTLQARPGTITSAVVSAANSVGYQSAASNPVAVPQSCALACVTVATTKPGKVVAHQSDGFLDSGVPANPSGLLPRQWRSNLQTLADTPDSGLSQLSDASITDLVSDDWAQTHSIAGYAFTPWSNWTGYSQWVTSDVQAVEALAAKRGFSVAYWDIQNEPFAGGYYAPGSMPPQTETVANVEQQFLVAYRAIKAADPNARIIGPSLIAWKAGPADTQVDGIDMRSFLDFCAANGLRFDAFSFHANVSYSLPGWYEPDDSPAQPAQVQTDVAQLRSMLAERPSLGSPQILVNEYGSPDTAELPGWSVGWIAALDRSGAVGAGRSCWDGCGPSLDGLLTSDGSQPLPAFWVYSFYAGMTGNTVPVTSSFTDVTGVASVASGGTISVLLGRHQNCTSAVNLDCPSLPAAPVTVQIQVPSGNSATVTLAAIPMGPTPTSPLYQLTPSRFTVPVTNGVATLSTPALHDGDAVEITVTPGP